MRLAVSAAHPTGQMVIADSPMRGTGGLATAICEARTWRNTSRYRAPQLGQRGLYRAIDGTMNTRGREGPTVDVEAEPKPTAQVTGEAS